MIFLISLFFVVVFGLDCYSIDVPAVNLIDTIDSVIPVVVEQQVLPTKEGAAYPSRYSFSDDILVSIRSDCYDGTSGVRFDLHVENILFM